MDTQDGDLSGPQQEAASDGRSVFAASSNHRCSLYFSPFHDPRALRTYAFLHSWDSLLVYAFQPWALIPQVLKKLQL